MCVCARVTVLENRRAQKKKTHKCKKKKKRKKSVCACVRGSVFVSVCASGGVQWEAEGRVEVCLDGSC